MSKYIINKTDLQKAAVMAAQDASKALQKLITDDTHLIISNVEAFEKPSEIDALSLANRCISDYKKGKLTVSADIMIFKGNNRKVDAGVVIMFINKSDANSLSNLMLNKIASDEARYSLGMQDSVLTEALNIIGNAYIDVIAKKFNKVIMSMVPKIIGTFQFDDFISSLILESNKKIYIMFDTELVVTKNVIRVPLILAVAINELSID